MDSERDGAIAVNQYGEVWTLNAEQSVAFARAVLDPPEPTAVQRAFAADYWSAGAEVSSLAHGNASNDDLQDDIRPRRVRPE